MGTRSNRRSTHGKPVNDDLSTQIGPVSAGWLAQIGISTVSEIQERGAIPVWVELKTQFPGVSLNMLYGLVALLRGQSWKDITPAERDLLKKEATAALSAVRPHAR